MAVPLRVSARGAAGGAGTYRTGRDRGVALGRGRLGLERAVQRRGEGWDVGGAEGGCRDGVPAGRGGGAGAGCRDGVRMGCRYR